jgi:poly(A) RNA polymerase GLD2
MVDESDLELILNVSAGPDINADDRVPLLRRLVEIFSSFEGVNVRIVNRIDYLQLTDHLSNLTCNVSLKNPIADLSIKLIKSYIEIDDRVASLINFIKVWTKVRAIKTSSQGYLSEFGYILCLIHYLQCRPVPILPSLQKLSKDWNGENFADSNSIGQDFVINPLDNSVVDCYFYAINDEDHLEKLKKVASKNTESVLSLLYCFFKFFSLEFDYRLSVVSVRHAKNIPKVDKAEVDGWPQNDRLSIEDPLEPSYDVAFNMKAPQFIHFRKEMLRAYQIIKKGEVDLYEMLLLPAQK